MGRETRAKGKIDSIDFSLSRDIIQYKLDPFLPSSLSSSLSFFLSFFRVQLVFLKEITAERDRGHALEEGSASSSWRRAAGRRREGRGKGRRRGEEKERAKERIERWELLDVTNKEEVSRRATILPQYSSDKRGDIVRPRLSSLSRLLAFSSPLSSLLQLGHRVVRFSTNSLLPFFLSRRHPLLSSREYENVSSK